MIHKLKSADQKPFEVDDEYLEMFAALFYLNGVAGIHEQRTGLCADSENLAHSIQDILDEAEIYDKIELRSEKGFVDLIEPQDTHKEDYRRNFAPMVQARVGLKRGRKAQDWNAIAETLTGEFTAKEIGMNKAVKLLELGLIKIARTVPNGGRGRPTNILIRNITKG